MDQTSHPSPAILVIIGSSAFSRHRLTDPVFVIAVRRPVPEPNVEAVIRQAKPIHSIVRPACLALPYRRTLALTNGSNA